MTYVRTQVVNRGGRHSLEGGILLAAWCTLQIVET